MIRHDHRHLAERRFHYRLLFPGKSRGVGAIAQMHTKIWFVLLKQTAKSGRKLLPVCWQQSIDQLCSNRAGDFCFARALTSNWLGLLGAPGKGPKHVINMVGVCLLMGGYSRPMSIHIVCTSFRVALAPFKGFFDISQRFLLRRHKLQNAPLFWRFVSHNASLFWPTLWYLGA